MLRLTLVSAFLLTSVCTAQDNPAPVDSTKLAAENRMLRAQVARQKGIIAELPAEIAALHGTADAPATDRSNEVAANTAPVGKPAPS